MHNHAGQAMAEKAYDDMAKKEGVMEKKVLTNCTGMMLSEA